MNDIPISIQRLSFEISKRNDLKFSHKEKLSHANKKFKN